MAEAQAVTDEQKNEFLFMQLVFMFQSAAMQHLGKVKNPLTDRIERDLDQARHTIDVLGMLEGKTRGNLSPQEKQFLEHALYELRMDFVDETRKSQEQPEEKKEEPS
ncbi:MAG: DUF1844 domain-containing protein [Candidatus Latescibacteria bacterium]|nr:DUF1844 domain-containing protein [Candidatus Latescibacterota bacterium]